MISSSTSGLSFISSYSTTYLGHGFRIESLCTSSMLHFHKGVLSCPVFKPGCTLAFLVSLKQANKEKAMPCFQLNHSLWGWGQDIGIFQNPPLVIVKCGPSWQPNALIGPCCSCFHFLGDFFQNRFLKSDWTLNEIRNESKTSLILTVFTVRYYTSVCYACIFCQILIFW